jgi:hypothetical protein
LDNTFFSAFGFVISFFLIDNLLEAFFFKSTVLTLGFILIIVFGGAFFVFTLLKALVFVPRVSQ